MMQILPMNAKESYEVGMCPSVGDRPIYFVAHDLRRRWPELDKETAVVPLADVPATRWAPLENIWVVSTYLRLAHAGYNVRLSDRLVPWHINVVCDERVIRCRHAYQAFCVVARADRAPYSWADHELVQSPSQLGRPNASLIGHWPQPGLIGRDPERGNQVDRLAYIGPVENLAASFKAANTKALFSELGVEFLIRDNPREWHDFSDIDAFVAVRDWSHGLIRTKPATKLVHAWLCKVPAFLGNEPAFRHWGSDGEDYFEVESPTDVAVLLSRFKQDPRLFQSVVEKGAAKSLLHDEDAVLRQWVRLLWGRINEQFCEWMACPPEVFFRRQVVWRIEAAISGIRRSAFILQSRGWRGLRGGVARRIVGSSRSTRHF